MSERKNMKQFIWVSTDTREVGINGNFDVLATREDVHTAIGILEEYLEKLPSDKMCKAKNTLNWLIMNTSQNDELYKHYQEIMDALDE